MITNEIEILLFLIIILAGIFFLSNLENKWIVFVFKSVPPILFCYFIPSFLVSLEIINTKVSDLNASLTKSLRPFCIFYFSLGLPLKQLKSIGKSLLLVFLAGSLGVIIGGPISLILSHFFFPESFNSESFKSMATIAGSWIGGTANQMALNAIFLPLPEEFAKAVTVDVFFGEIWLTLLLFLIPFQKKINQLLSSKTDDLIEIDWNQKNVEKAFTFSNILYILGLGFFIVQMSTFISTYLIQEIELIFGKLVLFSFLNKSFWTFFFCTLTGILLRLSKIKDLYWKGGDVISTLFLYLIIASVGLKISLEHLFSTPILLFTGFIWISIHGLAIFAVGKYLKAPYHYLAIASQANVGGIASASVIASAFSPRLTPLGVILALLGYAIGTYGGYISALLMQIVSVNF